MSDIENKIENSSSIKYTKDSIRNEKYQNVSSELIKLKNIINILFFIILFYLFIYDSQIRLQNIILFN